EEEAPGGPAEVHIDSPSDADLLRLAREEQEKTAPPAPAASHQETPSGEPPSPASGASNVAWVSLVEEAAPPSGAGVRVDSPSDADLLRHAQAEAAEAAPAETSAVNLAELGRQAPAEPAADLNLVPEAMGPEMSAVDLGAASTITPGGSDVGAVVLAEED